ncbi:hypothetical protein [Nonomuraea soli]|uniref:Uncharacterized protein n=1 Tax=Nonomuraea soli TaxID=1032476 RepID=A0A7W0CHK7_9ACTN|nr:hypothetical protein [Nonomuraea soli]MBA2891256.1 hypothetical protein [Nonomuraea soli]
MLLDEILGDRRREGRAELAEAMRMLSHEAEPEVEQAQTAAYFEPRLYTQLAQGGIDRATLTGLLHGPRDVTVVPGTTIELVTGLDPILAAFLADNLDRPEELSLVEDPASHLPALERALALIAAVRPVFHEALTESLRAVLLFRHPDAESFAALGMHGMIFLNTPAGAGPAYFVEQLTHQGGHVLFSEATLSRGDFFTGDPEDSLSGYVGGDDPRALYDAFHGLYTESMECQVYTALLAGDLPAEAERADFAERLKETGERHEIDLELISPHAAEIFSETGLAIHDCIRELKK